MGIGGIGMSGIAEILRLQGYTVSGCDLANSGKTVDYLEKIGCQNFMWASIKIISKMQMFLFTLLRLTGKIRKLLQLLKKEFL